MGFVVVAEHETLGRRVALVILRPELVASATAVERVRRGACAVAKLRQPGVTTARPSAPSPYRRP